MVNDLHKRKVLILILLTLFIFASCAQAKSSSWYEEPLQGLFEQGIIDEIDSFPARENISMDEFLEMSIRLYSGQGRVDHILTAKDAGLIDEKQDQAYEQYISRKDMVKILAKLLDGSPVSDIALPVKWQEELNEKDQAYFIKLFNKEIIQGYPDRSIRPDDMLTKAEAVTVLARVLEVEGLGKESFLPAGFVYLDEIIPDALYEMRYFTNNNFIGRRIDGYYVHRAICSEEAAEAIKAVQEELKKDGLGIKIFDIYRPQSAVEQFIRWAKDAPDTKMKAVYYPEVDKKDLFELNFIAERSGHSRGSTIDLTIIDYYTGEELDMGSPFDFFGTISNHDTDLINSEQYQNRQILKNIMEKHNFKPHREEWWHYTLNDEPYTDTYFDFPVK